jgi:hypothetical protein
MLFVQTVTGSSPLKVATRVTVHPEKESNHMTDVPDLSQLTEELAQPPAPDDTPSMRAIVYLKDPTETFELDLVNLEGVIIGMRVDGSSLLYIPWARVRHVEVPKSLNAAEPVE